MSSMCLGMPGVPMSAQGLWVWYFLDDFQNFKYYYHLLWKVSIFWAKLTTGHTCLGMPGDAQYSRVLTSFLFLFFWNWWRLCTVFLYSVIEWSSIRTLQNISILWKWYSPMSNKNSKWSKLFVQICSIRASSDMVWSSKNSRPKSSKKCVIYGSRIICLAPLETASTFIRKNF